jgi:hypothetical protein
MYVSIYSKAYSDEFTAVLLHTGDHTKVKQLFYVAVHCLMAGQ